MNDDFVEKKINTYMPMSRRRTSNKIAKIRTPHFYR